MGATFTKTDGLDRVEPAITTFRRLLETGKSLGITRIADITGLDRIGIPVYSAIVPCSDDGISVYNGKGLRPIDAKAGALMEAIERQTALKARPPHIESNYRHLSRHSRTLDPQRSNRKLRQDYSPQKSYDWIRGTDLFSQEEVWVPAHLAGYIWDDLPNPSPFEITDTTGIASGNNYLEAVCHALCEIVERDAWTFAELGAKYLPAARQRRLHGAAFTRRDDLEFCPSIEVPETDDLFQAFMEAGLTPIVRDITSELQIPTFLASVIDENIAGYPMAHIGFGASPDTKVALRRALSEVAQSRCVDIQSVREDILPPDTSVTDFALHTRRIMAVDSSVWTLGASQTRRRFENIESHSFHDLTLDLKFLLERLASCGMTEAIVIDFTPDCSTHSVVRVIVPGMELWASDHGRLGPRALRFWNAHA